MGLLLVVFGLRFGIALPMVLGLVLFYSKTGIMQQMSWRLLRQPSILTPLGLLDHSQTFATYLLNIGSHTRLLVMDRALLLKPLSLRLQMLSLLDGTMLGVIVDHWLLPLLRLRVLPGLCLVLCLWLRVLLSRLLCSGLCLVRCLLLLLRLRVLLGLCLV